MLRGIGTRRDCQILNVDFIGPKVRSGPVADALITAPQNDRFEEGHKKGQHLPAFSVSIAQVAPLLSESYTRYSN